MGWFQSLLSPLKRLWGRLHSTHRKRTGIYILYKDVKSCPCEDVHVLWSILVESGSVSASLPSKRSFNRKISQLMRRLRLDGLQVLHPLWRRKIPGYGLIYDSVENAKKYEPKYGLIRTKAGDAAKGGKKK